MKCEWISNRERLEAIEMGMDPNLLALVSPASMESVGIMLSATPRDPDGRSEWLWFRLPNGDLIFGCFPCGDTYFETELDHS